MVAVVTVKMVKWVGMQLLRLLQLVMLWRQLHCS
jgi:hypothetical protein